MTSKPPTENPDSDRHSHKRLQHPEPRSFLSVFGDTAIIIDGIAPYRWLNPDAPAHWLADVEKWRKANSVVEEHLSYEMGFWNVEGPYACNTTD